MEVVAFLGVTHILFGISLYILIFGFNIFNLLFVVLGALMPDIDTPHSLLGRFNVLAAAMKHRGKTHTLFIGVILSSLIGVYNLRFALAFGFGYLTHLIGDTLTPTGIMWLYPYKKKHYTLSTKNNDLRGIEGVVFAICMMYLFLGKIF